MIDYLFSIDHSKARSNGLKVASENIFDKYLIYPLVEIVSSNVHARISMLDYYIPNLFTFFSFVSRAVGIYALLYDNYKLAAVGFLVGYWFDCADGFYARKYDTCTNFGCLFDHTNDFVMFVLLAFVCMSKNMHTTVVLILFMAFFSLNEIAWTESEFNCPTAYFDVLCKMSNNFHILDKSFIKYFGTSTWAFIVALSMNL